MVVFLPRETGESAVVQVTEQNIHTDVVALASPANLFDVAVVGLGYVGLPLALLADRKGHRVVGIDISEKKVASIKGGVSPFFDEQIQKYLDAKPLAVDTDFARIRESEIVIVCVPTPVHEDHLPDLGPLVGACEAIAPHLQKGTLVVIESTINPGVCDTVVIPTLEKHSGLTAGVDFMVSHCPERVNPGDDRWSVENINRVAGSLTQEGLEKTLAFYRSIVLGDVRPMGSLKEAEAVKIVENTFRDVNIAFVNELALSFDKLGIDVVNVIEAASTKPFAFLPHYPSCGVGGHCIPVDPYYLIEEGRRNGFEHEFLSLARSINNRMPVHTVNLLARALEAEGIEMRGARIAVLGLAYKSDIDDTRESPARIILKELRARGAEAVPYDPFVKGEGAESIEDALAGAHGAIIATSHRAFRSLAPEDFLKHDVRIVIDGKNCLPKHLFVTAGIRYHGIGR